MALQRLPELIDEALSITAESMKQNTDGPATSRLWGIRDGDGHRVGPARRLLRPALLDGDIGVVRKILCLKWAGDQAKDDSENQCVLHGFTLQRDPWETSPNSQANGSRKLHGGGLATGQCMTDGRAETPVATGDQAMIQIGHAIKACRS